MGCFDDPYNGQTPYIYLTGDSFTWGWAPLQDKWGKEAQQLTGTRVLTCGVDGYGTRQELIKTTRQLTSLPTQPSLIMVGYLGANDINDDLIFPNHTIYDGYSVHSDVTCPDATCTIPTPAPSFIKNVKVWMATHSVLYTLFQREVYAPLLARIRNTNTNSITPPTSSSQLPSVHTNAMLGFAQLAQKENTKLVIILIPVGTDLQGTQPYTNEPMKEFLDAHHIAYLDLLPIFEKYKNDSLNWTINGHWNIAGNRLAGLAVSSISLRITLCR